MAKKQLTTLKNENFEVIGLISTQPHYKIAWQINKIADLNLTKLSEENLPEGFTFYKDKNIILIENNTISDTLISELKKFNYLIKIFNYNNLNNEQKKLFKSNKTILFSGIIDKNKLKKKSLNILNEIEE